MLDMDSFRKPLPSTSLDAAGLVALADLSAIQQRSALTGGASLLDVLILSPGIHMQQKATELCKAEYPACAALTSGYVFRVENPATVFYLQKVGRTGQLTTLSVQDARTKLADLSGAASSLLDPHTAAANLAYVTSGMATLAAIALTASAADWWGLAIILLLMLARACNTYVVWRRSQPGWFGQPEPGVKGDLLILLSQDRWVRLQGYVDDLKAVTSGQWLSDTTPLQSVVTSVGTVIVYLTAALATNAEQIGQIILVVLLLVSAGLLSIANATTKTLKMHGRTVRVVGSSKKYTRRLDLAHELIKETGRDDWAVRLGMINVKDSKSGVSTDGGVTM